MNISVDNPKVKFVEHLNQAHNDRILFSGKFGTGKSHFLKEFFKQEDNFDYNVFWISPVNYVVGANQDIFEWIKVDLAKELLFNYIQTTKTKKDSKNFLIQSFIYQNASDIFNELCLFVANKVSKKKTGIDFLDTFKRYIADYRKFEEKAKNANQSDGEKLDSFINSALLVKGTIFEDDLTTQIIRANIELLKYKSGKKSVLIIDDLDRIDPEHIFRILNILSCHNNHFDSNKFGFDKVILVCDIHNIKIIYEHKYGKADFEGYIEKFYTYEPFHYSLKNAIIDFCKKTTLENIDESGHIVFSLMLTLLLEENQLKIRNLKKILSSSIGNSLFPKYQYPVRIDYPSMFHQQDTFIAGNNISVDFNNFHLLHVLRLLAISCGGISELKNALVSLKRTNYPVDVNSSKHIFQSIIVLSSIARNNTIGQSNVFFNDEQPADRSHMNNIDYPNVRCVNTQVRIGLKWNKGNQYNDGDYFQNYSVGNTTVIKISDFLTEVIVIIDFALREHFFTNIKDS